MSSDKSVKVRKPPGPEPERLKIEGDPGKALRQLLSDKESPMSDELKAKIRERIPGVRFEDVAGSPLHGGFSILVFNKDGEAISGEVRIRRQSFDRFLTDEEAFDLLCEEIEMREPGTTFTT